MTHHLDETGPDWFTTGSDRFTLDDRLPDDYLADSLRADALKGLTARPKTLPPKWFYDARGSALFEEITRLPEYYPTRAEEAILRERGREIAEVTGAHTLTELGSGASVKTRLLLDALTRHGTLHTYAPQDVSPSALRAAGEALVRDYPRLRVAASVADFEADPVLPGTGPQLVAFLGGTLGNLDAGQRAAFYRTLRGALSTADALLLGVDLVKDERVLVRAYDDEQQVTAEFNKNVLRVLNRELGARFDPTAFEHRARWNAAAERIEMWLRARAAQRVEVPALALTVDFDEGEEMRTEISVKFRREALEEELVRGGFSTVRWWTDREGRFALLLAVPD